MAASARIDELRAKFDANPRRFFAPLANEYRKAGDLSTAIAICRTQLRLFPSHMSGNIVLGQALYEAGEVAEAQRVFERAIVLDPENLIALRHLGDIARATHDAPAARMWYRRVLDADPYNEAISATLAGLETVPPVDQKRPSVGSDELVAAAPAAVLAAEQAEVVEMDGGAELFVDFSEADFEWQPVDQPLNDAPVADEPESPYDPVVGLDLPPSTTGDVEPDPHRVDVAREAPSAVAAPTAEPQPPGGEPPPDLLVSSAFATETMAQLCLDQGHDVEALSIYDRLVAQRPGDARIRDRANALRARLHPDVPSDPTAGAFLRRLAETPADAMVTVAAAASASPTSSAAPHERDAWAVQAWGEAFAETAEVPEVRHAPSVEGAPLDLSFDRFFVGLEETPPARPAPPAPPPPTFSGSQVAVASRPSAVSPGADVAPEEPTVETEEDLAAFNAWLKDLRES